MVYLGCEIAFNGSVRTLSSEGHTIMTRLLCHSACLGLSIAAALGSARQASAANLDDVVKAFENNKEYVQPIATIFGSATNSGWYQSSAVPRGFSFYLGLPLNATLIADADRSFKATSTDPGCAQYHKNNPGGTQVCHETTDYTAPTLFGKGKGPVLETSSYSPADNSIAGTFRTPTN